MSATQAGSGQDQLARDWRFTSAAVLMLGSMLAGKLQPAPVRATARARNDRAAPGQREPRIWNDGRGTIIDL